MSTPKPKVIYVTAGGGRQSHGQPRRRTIKEPSNKRKDFIQNLAVNNYLLVNLTGEELKWIDEVGGYDVPVEDMFEDCGKVHLTFDEFRSYLRPGVCAVPAAFVLKFYDIEETLINMARDRTQKADVKKKDERLARRWLTLAAKLDNACATTPPEPWDDADFGMSGGVNGNAIWQDEWSRRPRSWAEKYPGEKD